jgi:hypothetical protein
MHGSGAVAARGIDAAASTLAGLPVALRVRRAGRARPTAAEAVVVRVLAAGVGTVTVLIDAVGAHLDRAGIARWIVVVAVDLAHRGAEHRVRAGARDGHQEILGRTCAGRRRSPREAITVGVFAGSEGHEPDRVPHHTAHGEAALCDEVHVRARTLCREHDHHLAWLVQADRDVKRRLADLGGRLVDGPRRRAGAADAVERDDGDRQITHVLRRDDLEQDHVLLLLAGARSERRQREQRERPVGRERAERRTEGARASAARKCGHAPMLPNRLPSR